MKGIASLAQDTRMGGTLAFAIDENGKVIRVVREIKADFRVPRR